MSIYGGLIRPVNIDTAQHFPHLKNAPIVEAVIGVTAKQTVAWEEKTLSDFIKTQIPGYPLQRSNKQIVTEVQIKDGKPNQRVFDAGWSGIQCTTEDGLHVVQFNKDGFVFSRLKPYENWEKLKAEGLRLWKIYAGATRPSEIHRLGLRYINAIVIPPIDETVSSILKEPPKAPENLPWHLTRFMDQDAFSIPEHPFTVQIVKTIQSTQTAGHQGSVLIIDIDVSMTNSISESGMDTLEKRLDEMRCLKNMAFFGSLTDQVVETFK